jgi:nucleoside transporter
MNPVRLKLSALMFLEYFIWGAWYVTMGTYLGQALKFSGTEIGLAYGATAIAAMISPFFVGMVADRFFASERVLALLHIVGAILLYAASQATSFGLFYAVMIGYALCFMPTLALSNSLSFDHLRDPQREFPQVRVLGTIGWIVAGLIVGRLGLEPTAVPLRLAAGASLVLGVFSLMLPHTPPHAAGQPLRVRDVLGLDALSLFRDRSFATFMAGSFLLCIPLQFYYAFTNPFLNEIGFQNAVGKMTFGQFSELLFMLTLPFFFKKVGVKYTLVLGMLAWVIRYLCFGFGNVDTLVWMLYLGIVLHGICYDFFFVTGQVYVDMKAPIALRSAAQGLIVFLTYGIGMFVGSWICGKVVDTYATTTAAGVVSHNWRSIWMVPAVFALFVLIFFLIGFRTEKADPTTT